MEVGGSSRPEDAKGELAWLFRTIMKLPTLRKTGEFREVYSRGRKVHTRFFTMFFLDTPEREFKYGLTVSRRIGSHVTRNRVKRRLREIIRWWAGSSRPPCHIVIVAKDQITAATFQDLQKSFSTLMGRLLND
ncbi:MAG: ribonuclease P protein component [bacterium]|nr:ribonuclease P protein component [bacterium]